MANETRMILTTCQALVPNPAVGAHELSKCCRLDDECRSSFSNLASGSLPIARYWCRSTTLEHSCTLNTDREGVSLIVPHSAHKLNLLRSSQNATGLPPDSSSPSK